MMRWRSISMPGTPRGDEPVATMISLRARSVCVSPSKTSTPPLPVRRAVPLIQSILFFLNRNSTPLVRPRDDPVLARLDLGHVDGRSRDGPDGAARAGRRLTPHSFACWTTFMACACSSSALVGNAAPQQAGAAERLLLLDDGDLEAELRGADRRDVAAGSGADHDHVVVLGHVWSRFASALPFQRGQGDEMRRACRRPPAGRRRAG